MNPALLGPENVAANVDFARPTRHSNVVAGDRVERVVGDADIADAEDVERDIGVSIEDVVDDDLFVVRENSRRVARDSVELNSTIDIDSDVIPLDEVRGVKIVSADDPHSRHADRVAPDVLIPRPFRSDGCSC